MRYTDDALPLNGLTISCSPSSVIFALSTLDHNPTPTRDEVRSALAGNLCRCTGYTKILDAVELAALRMKGNASRDGAEEPAATSPGRRA